MKRRGVARAYAVSALCYLVMPYALALLASYTQATSFVQGLWLGFLLWLGLPATLRLTPNTLSDNPPAVRGIDRRSQAPSLLLEGAVDTLRHRTPSSGGT